METNLTRQTIKGPSFFTVYRVLQSFTEERTRTEAWRASGIAKYQIFNAILKKLIQVRSYQFLYEKDNGRLIITDTGRTFCNFMEAFVSVNGSNTPPGNCPEGHHDLTSG